MSIKIIGLSRDDFMKLLEGEIPKTREAQIRDRQAAWDKIIEDDQVEFEKALAQPNATKLPELQLHHTVEMMADEAVRQLNNLTQAKNQGAQRAFLLALAGVQATIMELTAELYDAGLPVVLLQGVEETFDAADRGLGGEGVEDEPDLAARIEASNAEKLKLQAGAPFDIETLFLGRVPSFDELPDCGADPCPACDARRSYFANRKVH